MTRETFGMEMARKKREARWWAEGDFCMRCCSTRTTKEDGTKVGGLPGVTYATCQNCGRQWPVQRRV